MSSHPNTVLILVLKPEDLPMRTFRALCAEFNVSTNTSKGDNVQIGSVGYNYCLIDEDGTNDYYKLRSEPGDILFFHHMTTAWGNSVSWEDAERLCIELIGWAGDVSTRHKCSFDIRIGANYW